MSIETQDLCAVLERLVKVEKKNRRLKQAGVAILVIGAACMLIGQASPKARTIEAERFMLLDRNGKMRGGFGTFEDGETSLSLFDLNEKERAALVLDAAGNPTFRLGGKDGETLLDVSLNPSGAASLMLFARSGKGGVSVAVDSHGTPAVELRDSGGDVRASLSLFKEGAPGLGLLDKAGRARITVLLFPDGSPQIALNDESTRNRAVFGFSSLVAGRTGEVTSKAPSSVVLFDKEGKVIWSAP